MQDKDLAEFEARASEAEKKLDALEQNGIAVKNENKQSEKPDQPSALGKAEYRVMFLMRALSARDDALRKAEEAVAKRDYQIMHLQRALDRVKP